MEEYVEIELQVPLTRVEQELNLFPQKLSCLREKKLFKDAKLYKNKLTHPPTSQL